MRRDQRLEPCSVEGCPNNGWARGWCSKHYKRWRKTGDPLGVLPPRDQRGPRNVRWKGDDVGYRAAHCRVACQRGGAADHFCVGCGGPALEWSYDYSDPMPLHAVQNGSVIAYSPDPANYSPRCKACHAAFDRDQRGRSCFQ